MRVLVLPLIVLVGLVWLPQSAAQDRILLFGNSIIGQNVGPYLADLVEEMSMPRPIVTSVSPGSATTSTFVSLSGTITTSLPAGETWRAMVVQGNTVETTSFMGNPNFQSNMLTLAGVLYSHSPNAQFVGHETGADHPTNTNAYPAWFPDAETWLAFPQAAYATAQAAIIGAHPTALPARTALQGTMFAKTTGYDLAMFNSDLHHLSFQGRLATACLYLQEIYGGKICDLPVDFSGSSALLQRLLAHGISEDDFWKVAGYVDRIQPQSERSYPGSDSDFQLRAGVNSSIDNLCTTKVATVGDVLTVSMLSPLNAADSFVATCFAQTLSPGSTPGTGLIPGLYLDRPSVFPLFGMADLQASSFSGTVPPGLAGHVLWLQGASTMPSTDPAYPYVLSDAQRIEVQ